MTTFLLTWNPDTSFAWDDISDDAAEVVETGTYFGRWSFGRRVNAEIGDRVFMIKQGPTLPRGIMASGRITRGPFPDLHWEDPSKTASYVDVEFDTILVPERDQILDRELLNAPEFISMYWNAQSSGTEIREPIASELEKLWAEILKENGNRRRFSNRVKKGKIQPPQFGEVDGYSEGHGFATRREMFDANVHRQIQAGISGTGKHGAYSIVLSGGHEDDEDFGDEIIYTGEGGRDQKTGQQVLNQPLTKGNLALARSHTDGQPVRVIRGHTHKSRFSPRTGYRYDGLFRVDEYWQERGQSGFQVWRYRLIKLAASEADTHQSVPGPNTAKVERKELVTLRIVRDTKLSKAVKKLYDYRCQVCGTRIETPGGPYAEGAHIRPLGSPHNGKDSIDNVLCLCPNHHVMFDNLAFTIADDFQLIGISKILHVDERHPISTDNLRYHRKHCFKDNS